MASTLVRLPYTPLQDLLRGEVSGRLDWRGLIADAELSSAAKALLIQVIEQTRLWRIERADVAGELLSHFYEGLDAGKSESDLIQEFGDPRRMARLIRRGKIRCRPIAWHVFRWTSWLLAAACVFYVAVAVRYYEGRPSRAANLVNVINGPIARAAQGESAWPIYQAAVRWVDQSGPVLGYAEDGPHWPEIARWIDDHQAVIASVIRASSLRTLGGRWGNTGGDLGNAAGGAAGSKAKSSAFSLGGDQSLNSLPVPELVGLRKLADLLAFDARRARERGDGARVEADIMALAGMSQQEAREVSLTPGQMCSLDLLARSYDELDRTLVEKPGVLPDAALVRIAHRMSVPQTGSDLISFGGERRYFEDVLQRTFTDDGRGDGYFSAWGWEYCLANYLQQPRFPSAMSLDRAPGAVLEPACVLVMGSRKDQRDEYDRLMDMDDAMIRVPLREADSYAASEELRTLHCSALSRWRYSLVLMAMPALHRSAELAERTLGQRDGLLVGLALEMYHRRNQRYPDHLEQLTPGLLPAVPLDRITGDPLKYRLVDGAPLVYSVGVDRVDDGGRVPICDGIADPDAAAKWGKYATVVAGDWVLYPKVRPSGGEEGN